MTMMATNGSEQRELTVCVNGHRSTVPSDAIRSQSAATYSCPVCGKGVPSNEGRITGCINEVEEAACLIWVELNPNEVMGNDDLPHYEAAAKAVLARFTTSIRGAGS